VDPTIEARAPAKLNLGLRIRARRPDGYHELDSVFVPLDLHDRLVLRISGPAGDAPRVELTLDPGAESGVPGGADNLAARAALRFLERATLRHTVRIALAKRIPAGAGLGGGSSDAGTVLRQLADAFPAALPRPALHELALSLGADVPYFLDPRPARVGGVGERITPLAAGLPKLHLLLLNPGVVLPTAEVYRAFDALVPDPADPAYEAARARQSQSEGRVAGLSLANDLEPAALRLCPQLARLRRRLEALGASAVGMSGSGATLFGVFPGAAEAEAARDGAALPEGAFARVASTLESR